MRNLVLVIMLIFSKVAVAGTTQLEIDNSFDRVNRNCTRGVHGNLQGESNRMCQNARASHEILLRQVQREQMDKLNRLNECCKRPK